MIKNNKIYFATVGVLAIVTVFFFQNCTGVAFNTGLSSESPIVDGSGTTPIDVDPGIDNGGGNGGGGSDNGGTEPGYSEKCDDYAAKGFASKDECLQDGGWHIVDPTDPNEIERHVFAGADVKVIIPNQYLYSNGVRLAQTMTGNEECQQIYRSQSGSRPFYCLTTVRFQGEANGQTNHGSVRYGTDGSIFCNGLSNPGSNGCTVDRMTFKWYIRY